ncbi:MAG: putative 4-mercaptohistidine N1-methyltransferase [Gammaproteobacteria bacterium]|uniref:putative 4-mercaptohistidine N1-methyltransferase n=1 Tax=Limnobacter sp. TaxID=2003368 RepID=UPI001E14FE15|nr:putative 4-mercaptohistidine N1-methyltransferase [Limnobacter sp.]MBU0782615.1 putative 4-mercaptohistidine N1-methyltransferase [Gammaproteobacteria bacterium]MBU0850203.1 putative 4-mercaptohistidine N1-methyltransferase [Gammaproteobacteria bacterium]MBU1266301.1 putative 4-mercaptohistidine N1-methyltransferase [Gammaproteobacteria bacterium]MBU1528643.1 putative 4-mercaptohistidine N1-methyltransferase [Gammaproteobacteria bacterium]MBU1780826.1 putative 4-mercaptohistidine N1-methylt
MNNPYETDELLNQYLAFHYGSAYFDVPNYPEHCAQLCIEFMGKRPRQKALDLGCAVGRSSFDLAKGFDAVLGIDLSSRFIDAANRLKFGETLPYYLHDEGELGHTVEISLKTTEFESVKNKVQFEVGDACQLGSEHTQYDLIFAGNLIDRVNNPSAFLSDLAHRIVPGGLLVISSPYTLLTEYTPKQNWIGGLTVNGEPRTVLQGMQTVLEPHFKLLAAPRDVPFVIRETSRKFQHSIAEMSVWERRGG